MSYEQERLLFLQNKYGLSQMQLDNSPRQTAREINLAQWIDQKAAEDNRNVNAILKTKTVAYGGAKDGKGLVRFWLEVSR